MWEIAFGNHMQSHTLQQQQQQHHKTELQCKIRKIEQLLYFDSIFK